MLVTSHVLPAARVIIAKSLIEAHDLKPVTVAARMGLTPAAVTQYVSGVRGAKLVGALQGSNRARRVLDRLVDELLKAQSDALAVMPLVCELCRIVREEHMLCSFCDLAGRGHECDLCLVSGCRLER
jgi:predicted transcriptional regulator